MKTVLNQNTKVPFLIMSLIMALSSFSGIFALSSSWYVACIFVFFLIYILPSLVKVRNVNVFLLAFLVICILSIIINDPPHYFRAWERLLAFLLVLLAFSPIISSEEITKRRMRLFDTLFIIMILFSCASFIGYFFGTNYFIRDGVTLDYSDSGHFSGFMNHSMMLAPISSLSCIYSLATTISIRNSFRKKLLWFFFAITCLGSVLLSGSRGATGAMIFAFLVMIYRYNSGRIGKMLKYLLIITAVLAATASIWITIANPVIEKNRANEENGSLFYSREEKMAARFYEIKNNPFSGVGFATVDETVDSVDKVKGTIEPNSSWLAVFSMTGVFGFVCFLVFFFQLYKGVLKKIDDRYLSTLMIGILSFFLIHLITEGYVMAAGSILCGLFWFSAGVAYGLIKMADKVTKGLV